METTTLGALLAGFLVGAALGLATTGITLVALARSPAWGRRAAAARVSLPVAGVVIVNAQLLLWTLIGLGLGAAFRGAETRHPAGGLLSPNWLFSLLVAAAAAFLLLAATIVRGRLSMPVALSALVAALAFGWLLPLLAVRA